MAKTNKGRPVGPRRPSYFQRRGLEITGHAREYLIDGYAINISAPEEKTIRR